LALCIPGAFVTEAVFWLIISLFDWSKSGNDAAVIEPAVAELSKKSEPEIVAFEEILAQKLYALDTVAHAKEIGEEAYVGNSKHFSSDWFLYSRCAVVANGLTVYERVLANPKTFPKDLEFEAILSVGPAAYKRKTGKEFSHVTKFDYETYSNKAGWQ